jgi:glycine/D-amino acid oxidase-like deaminating enzyme
MSTDLIRRAFPNFSDDIRVVVHIRRAGDIRGQQLGQYMLDQTRDQGLERVRGTVCGLECANGFRIQVDGGGERHTIEADIVVNAAGPFVNEVGSMLDYTLPVRNVLQQKIAFEDRARSIARDTPFSIDLDSQSMDWSEEERQLLLEDPDNAWLAREMPGGIHCKAEGGEHGTWVKLGWAYNSDAADPDWQPPLDDRFPEIVLRGAARLNPALKAYYGRLPRQMSHYGGYYTMTDENWPLLGPAGPEGSFVVSALSGFGTMAACGAGFLVARMISGASVPPSLSDLTLQRYDKPDFVSGLVDMARSSIL